MRSQRAIDEDSSDEPVQAWKKINLDPDNFEILRRICARILALSVSACAGIAPITGTTRTIEGDTFDLGVVRIGLHAIDAREADQPCNGTDGSEWRCSVAASNRLCFDRSQEGSM